MSLRHYTEAASHSGRTTALQTRLADFTRRPTRGGSAPGSWENGFASRGYSAAGGAGGQAAEDLLGTSERARICHDLGKAEMQVEHIRFTPPPVVKALGLNSLKVLPFQAVDFHKRQPATPYTSGR